MESASATRPRSAGQKRATLTEIASRAGVSLGAASVALNGSKSNVGVSSATRERILQVAAEMNYRPNAIARSLRSGRTNIIAFYNAQDFTFDPRYPFYSAILAGVQAGCADQKKHLLLYSKFEGHSGDDVFSMLHDGHIDGLVLYVRTVNSLVQRLIESQLPVVTVAEQVPGLPYVGIDEEQGGRLLARHLAEKGYKKVLYHSTDERTKPATQQQRMAAFCREATALGVSVTERDSDPDSWAHQPLPDDEKLCLSDPARRPDAIACWGDMSADGIAAYCMENGIRIPQDIALVGFDHFPAVRRPSLRLTTIHAPWDEVARTAVNVLVAQCEGRRVPSATILPVDLVVGDTT